MPFILMPLRYAFAHDAIAFMPSLIAIAITPFSWLPCHAAFDALLPPLMLRWRFSLLLRQLVAIAACCFLIYYAYAIFASRRRHYAIFMLRAAMLIFADGDAALYAPCWR